MYNNNRINQFQQQQQQQQQQYTQQFNNNNSYYGGYQQNNNQYQMQQGGGGMMQQQNYNRFQQQQQQQHPDTDISLYIGELAPDVTETQLLNAFQSRFPSVRQARVIMDSQTGLSRGYGFVKFTNDAEKEKALIDMNGFYLNNRAIKVNNPTHKRLNSQTSTIPDLTSTDPNNTAIYVSQLDHYIDEGVLQTIFGAYGEISYIKMLNNKFSAFVNYVNRESAEAAFGLNNYAVGNTRLKVQWGKNMAPPPKSPPITNTIINNNSSSPMFSNFQNNASTLSLSPSSSNLNNNNGGNVGIMGEYYNNVNNLNNYSQPNKPNSIYDPNYSYFSNEKLDITKAYNINEENKAYISWNKQSLNTNYYSSNNWNLKQQQKDGPDASVLEA